MNRKKILKYISIVIIIKIVLFALVFMYSVESVEEEIIQKKLKIHDIQGITAPAKEVFSAQELEKQKNDLIRWKLEEKMKAIYTSVSSVYNASKKKKENLKALKTKLDMFADGDIFVATYYEKTLYGSNDYKDINARTIVLEEIQKVRRHGKGFIVSTINSRGLKRYTLVKDLNFLDLYIGVNIFE